MRTISETNEYLIRQLTMKIIATFLGTVSLVAASAVLCFGSFHGRDVVRSTEYHRSTDANPLLEAGVKTDTSATASHGWNLVVIYVIGWLLTSIVLTAFVHRLIRNSISIPLTRIGEKVTDITSGVTDSPWDVRSYGVFNGLVAGLQLMTKAHVSALKNLHDELAILKEQKLQIHEEKVSAESANQSKSEFLANMSHELRTPLSAILGFADVLQQVDESGNELNGIPFDESVDSIRRNGEHLLSVINQVLDISKLEAGEIVIANEPCSPFEILEDVCQLTKLQTDSKHLQFKLDVLTPLPKSITSDAMRIKQVLINLTANAVKFTEQGTVTLQAYVSAVAGQSWLRFVVVDTGIGCSEYQLAQVFDRFRQVDASKRFDGSGLGLSISRALTQELGGIIEANSCEGVGSEFTVSFPICPKELETKQTLNEFRRLQASQPNSVVRQPNEEVPSTMKVLYAEDGPDNQRLVSYILTRTGYEVVIVNDGIEAIEELRRNFREDSDPYDVVLMDMQMPRLDGYQATRQLREEGFTLPIIALTAHAMTEDRRKCLEAGCTEYLSKPIKPATLREVIGEMISQCAHATVV